MTFSDRPLTVVAADLGLPLDSPSLAVALEDMERTTASGLEELRELGFPIRILSQLTHVLHGAVIEVPSTKLQRLEAAEVVTDLHRDQIVKLQLDRSLDWIGVVAARGASEKQGTALTGAGVRVAVIDSGIDYTHPDLGGGFGAGRKVIGGYDLVDDDNDPLDTLGHGTLVAGIIAANGSLVGVAPEAELLAYRVTTQTSRQSSLNVVRALEMSVKDGAKVVNISIESGSPALAEAIHNAVGSGVTVVAAAGNSGPRDGSIADPASDPNVLAVGASLNNSPLSVVSRLSLTSNNFSPDVLPLNGAPVLEEGVQGRLVPVDFARIQDVDDIDLSGSIALAERGGEGSETVYFSEKEENVVSRGAVGLVIYNNRLGDFTGTLTGPQNPPGYRPSIPVVSVAREHGLLLKEQSLEGVVEASLTIKVAPDTVAYFSSRGPESAFDLKPDLVAPGAFINTTFLDEAYRLVDGTSFSAPHVAGAAALILQLHPDLRPEEVSSLLTTSSVTLKDGAGEPVSVFRQGSGRLDVLSSVEAPVLVTPSHLIIHLAPNQRVESSLVSVTNIRQERLDFQLAVSPTVFEGIELELSEREFEVESGGTFLTRISANLGNAKPGIYESRIFLTSGERSLVVPIILYVNAISIDVLEEDGVFTLSFQSPEGSRLFYAEAIGPTRTTTRTRLSLDSQTATFVASERGEYRFEVRGESDKGPIFGRAISTASEAAELALPVPTSEPLEPPVLTSLSFVFIVGIMGLMVLLLYTVKRRESTTPRNTIQITHSPSHLAGAPPVTVT